MSRRAPFVVASVAIAVGFGAAASYAADTGVPHGSCPSIVAFELAGNEARATRILECWGDVADDLREGFDKDTVFIAAYVLTLAWWAWYGARHSWFPWIRRAGPAFVALALVTGGLDLLENHWLRDVVGGDADKAWLASAAATAKWLLLLACIAYALGALGTALGRVATILTSAFRSPADGPPRLLSKRVFVDEPAPVFEHRYCPPSATAVDRPKLGLALSGGGIRSASFNLGVLQDLQERSVLARADVMATVSGGGYIGGARQMLLHQGAASPPPFAVGTPERQHLAGRRQYLWNTRWRALTGSARLVGGIAVNLGILLALVFVAGWSIGWLAREQALLGERGTLKPALGHGVGALVAVVIGGIAYVARATRATRPLRSRARRPSWTAYPAIGLALVGTGLLVLWAYVGLTYGGDGIALRWLVILVASVVGGVVVCSQVLYEWAEDKRRIVLAVGMWLVVAVPLGLWLASLGEMRVPEGLVFGVAAGGLALLYIGLDQRGWSAHVFYKHRLASAFAIRRTSSGTADEIPWRTETTLSEWAAPTGDGPELVVSAAVHTSHPTLLPNRRVWSFSFAHDYVGGPDVGWCRTVDFEAALRRTRGGDRTLLAAMAISGAAVASSMGVMSRGSMNALLAVTNLRLGVWVPNPRYVWALCNPDDRGGLVAWVHIRRFGYMLKEVFGRFDLDDRFVYVSDGGHLDNLALLELVARRCETIVLFDASGDQWKPERPVSAAATLFGTVKLATERFGVTFHPVGDPSTDLVREEAFTALVAPLAPTADDSRWPGRVSHDCVCTFAVSYPSVGGGPTEHGTIVVAKSVVTPEALADATIAAAMEYDRFPRDATYDQWLDDAQYDGYIALGRYVAGRLPPP